MQPDIRISTRKKGKYFIGRLKFYENGKYLYSESCLEYRLNKADALEDAEQERAYTLERNVWENSHV